MLGDSGDTLLEPGIEAETMASISILSSRAVGVGSEKRQK